MNTVVVSTVILLAVAQQGLGDGHNQNNERKGISNSSLRGSSDTHDCDLQLESGAHSNLDLNGGLKSTANGSINGATQVNTITHQVPVPVPQPYTVSINRPVLVPVAQPYPVAVPRPVQVPVPVPRPVVVPRPVAVPVNRPVPIPVAQPVAVPITRPVRVLIPQPYPVTVRQYVPVRVPQPLVVAVAQPVYAGAGNRYGGQGYETGSHSNAYISHGSGATSYTTVVRGPSKQ